MTLQEMRTCAAETLTYFIRTMPDVPFREGDIIIEFAPKVKMAERAKALCAQYVPDKIINESQAAQLNQAITANALIGRNKSAVIARINYKMSRQDWRRVFFHEYMHIFCAKIEMDGDHFIEVYGSGTTPENSDFTPEEREYDGYLVAGYKIWSEFIAQYYALLKTEDRTKITVAREDAYINSLLAEVTIFNMEESKGSLSMACAYLLTCADANETVAMLKEPDDEMPESQKEFLSCLFLIYEHLQNEKPWKINEEFIVELGKRFIRFRMLNSVPTGR